MRETSINHHKFPQLKFATHIASNAENIILAKCGTSGCGISFGARFISCFMLNATFSFDCEFHRIWMQQITNNLNYKKSGILLLPHLHSLPWLGEWATCPCRCHYVTLLPKHSFIAAFCSFRCRNFASALLTSTFRFCNGKLSFSNSFLEHSKTHM